MDKDYNPNQKPVSLCEGCAAGGFRKCQRTSEDQYFSSSGAFRCLTESESRGSIIVHSLIYNHGGLIFFLDFMGTTHWHPDIELWNTIFILSLYHGSTMLYPYKSVKNLKAPLPLPKKKCAHINWNVERNWYFQFLLNKRLTFHLLFCKWFFQKKIFTEGGDIAFVKHLTVRGNTDGRRQSYWARNRRSDDYELMCKDGRRTHIDDWENCHLGQIPASAMVTASKLCFW